MANPYQTKEFKKLFRKWNKKLKAANFKDIENYLPDGPQLKLFTSTRFNRVPMEELKARAIYDDWARRILEKFIFKNKLERKIWELHEIEGISDKEIPKMLKITRWRVRCALARIKKANGMPYGKP